LKLQEELDNNIYANMNCKPSINAIKAAYIDEVSELLQELPWKYWKVYDDFTVNWNKVKLELVDAFHFILSIYIRLYGTSIQISDIPVLEAISKVEASKSNITNKDIIYDVIDILTSLLCYLESEPKGLFLGLFLMAAQSYINLEDLFTLYKLKNALNRLRQERIYTSKYIYYKGQKVEDNELLFEMLPNSRNKTFDSIYYELKQLIQTGG